MTQADIGVVGLAVMGQNLARNIARRGTRVAVYNRTYARTEALMHEHPDPNLLPAVDLPALIASLHYQRIDRSETFHSKRAAS